MNKQEKYMQLALKQAIKAWGKTSPNPLVGAIIVKNNKIIGQGYHKFAGDNHAEINAIKSCQESTKNATCYVTLEPCSTYSKTPPCIQALIDAKISHVIIGSFDDNPQHQGRAVKLLEKNLIKVTYNTLIKECRKINLPFFHWIKYKQPFVTLKMAMTLDGKIATKSGESQWITGKKSREYVQKLRQRSDAIMVGGETVRKDNPSLRIKNKKWKKQPKKFIWSQQKFSDNLKIMQSSRATIIKPQTKNEWEKILAQLGQNNCTNLLIEGGGELAANALHVGIINEIYFFIAPKILGGKESRPVIAGISPNSLTQAYNLIDVSTEMIGEDILINAIVS